MHSSQSVMFSTRALLRACKHQGCRDSYRFPLARVPVNLLDYSRAFTTESCWVGEARKKFPALSSETAVYCDGAGGTQVPETVIETMSNYMRTYGCTNNGGNYSTSQQAEHVTTRARMACADLLGAASPGEVLFGLNCTNLMFHLARAIKRSLDVAAGDNIVLSRTCHEANIAPWLRLAERRGLETRWIEGKGTGDDSCKDELMTDNIDELIDDKTRVVSLGLASNVTGRINVPAIEEVNRVAERMDRKPIVVLDGTHFVPHRRCNLHSLGADAVVCSSYKFFGPHLGVMAVNSKRFSPRVQPAKVGLRFHGDGNMEDLLYYGEHPNPENSEISGWEMGTQSFEALAGLEATVEYLKSLGGAEESLDTAFHSIVQHEGQLSARFLSNVDDLVSSGKLRLFGSRSPADRTPTFAMAVGDAVAMEPHALVDGLNRSHRGVRCTHGHHYAVEMVEPVLGQADGVTRVSFVHYNTMEEVDYVTGTIREILSG